MSIPTWGLLLVIVGVVLLIALSLARASRQREDAWIGGVIRSALPDDHYNLGIPCPFCSELEDANVRVLPRPYDWQAHGDPL